MTLSELSLRKLNEIITGDCNYTPYLTGKQLVGLFNQVGLKDVYSYKDGGLPGRISRTRYTSQCLQKINNSDNLTKLLELIADERNYVASSFKLERTIENINAIIKYDGYHFVNINGIYKVRDLSTAISDYSSVQKEKKFYSIYIQVKNSFEQYFILDLTSKAEVITDYVEPFARGKEFLFAGYLLQKQKIKRFIIKESSDKISEIVDEAINETIASSGAWFKPNFDDEAISILTRDTIGKFIETDLINKVSTNQTTSKNKNIQNLAKISKKVFIIHGHDNEMKSDVARLVEKLGLEPIILHEHASNGNTIIEKFESFTSESSYGIALYSPCDVGKAKSENEFHARTRQNVIFEHGYLMAKLGRNHVCALVKENIEKPSDIAGILYINYSDGWELKLAKELNKSGFEIDLNKLLA